MSHEATNWAFKQRGLKPAAKIVLLALADRHNPDMGCFPSKKTLAEDCELSERSVYDQLRLLEDMGLIYIEPEKKLVRGQYASNRYILGFEPDFPSQNLPSAKSAVGKSQQKPSAKSAVGRRQNLPTNPVREPCNITSNGGGGSAGAREDDLTPREQILAAMGVGPDGVIGPSRFLGSQGDMAEAKLWLEMPGLTLPVICEEIRRICREKADGPPKSFRYFSPALQRLSGQLTAAPLQPIFGSAPSAAPAKAHTVTFDLSKFDDFGNRIS